MRDSEPKPGERENDLRFTDDTLAVDLINGRTIIVPLIWSARLLDATADQRRNWHISAAGIRRRYCAWKHPQTRQTAAARPI
jgi:hypothetical protein